MKPVRTQKAISPIIATLLLILIAIAAGVVVYAYVVGFVGNSTSNSGATTNTLSMDSLSSITLLHRSLSQHTSETLDHRQRTSTMDSH